MYFLLRTSFRQDSYKWYLLLKKKKMHNIHNVNTLIKLMGEKKREIYVCIVLYNTNQNNCLTKLCSVVFIDISTLSWNVTTLVIVVTLHQELHLLFSQKKKELHLFTQGSNSFTRSYTISQIVTILLRTGSRPL